MHKLEIAGLLPESWTGCSRGSAAHDGKCAGGGTRDIRAIADAAKHPTITEAEKNQFPSLFAGSSSARGI